MYGLWAWLFFFTAGVGAWAAYDQVAALQRLTLLAVGLVVVYVIDRLGSIDAERTLVWGGIGCAALAALLGALVLLPSQSALPFHNAIASGLIILLPLGAGICLWMLQRRFWFVAGLLALALTWALVMLFLTAERSAWFALALATLTGLLIQQRFAWARRKRNVVFFDILAIVVAVVLLTIYMLLIALPDFYALLPLGERLTVLDHLEAWRDALVLIQDYPFTGSGLGATAMVYSTYVLLSHVPVLNHVHNLYLQLAVEQGLLGLLAFVGMAAAAFYALISSWRKGARFDDSLRSATFVALAAMLMHGLLDSELYASWLLPLLFLPFGFVLVAARLDQYVIDDFRLGRQKFPRRRSMVSRVVAGAVGLVFVVVAVMLAFTPAVQATFLANVGAVAQSQIELSVYSWPQWPVQDAVRRSETISLEAATVRYEAALAIDPTNATAHRRLGQIALSRGDYDAARQHLQIVSVAAPYQRITGRLLGEVYAVTGAVEQAVEIWRPLNLGIDEIERRQWWYSHIGATNEASRLARAIVLFANLQATSNK